MFSPECKAEYRPGFTRCADCDVDLVANLTEVKPESEDRSDLREVWTGDEQESCVDTCLTLKEAGIPYEVTQRQTQFLQAAEAHFKIAVPLSFYKQAKELTGPDTDDFSDKSEDQTIIELPDDGIAGSTDTRPASGRYFADWYPEDATIEVTTDSARAWSALIMNSLRENFIRCRESSSPDGSKQIFVLPDDESRARVIVREIEQRRQPSNFAAAVLTTSGKKLRIWRRFLRPGWRGTNRRCAAGLLPGRRWVRSRVRRGRGRCLPGSRECHHRVADHSEV